MIKDIKILSALFALPLFCLMAWAVFLTYNRDTGTDVRVAVQGYDPRDLFSGRYIRYTIDWDKTSCGQFADGVCPRDEFCAEVIWGRQCRFYIPEEYASTLDSLFWLSDQNDLHFEVIYSYKPKTSPIAKQLLINDMDWREYLKNNPKVNKQEP